MKYSQPCNFFVYMIYFLFHKQVQNFQYFLRSPVLQNFWEVPLKLIDFVLCQEALNYLDVKSKNKNNSYTFNRFTVNEMIYNYL